MTADLGFASLIRLTAFDVANEKGKPSGHRMARFIYDEKFYNMGPTEFVLQLAAVYPGSIIIVSPSVARRLPDESRGTVWRQATADENKFGNVKGQAWAGWLLPDPF